jgi:subtilase family serine protease
MEGEFVLTIRKNWFSSLVILATLSSGTAHAQGPGTGTDMSGHEPQNWHAHHPIQIRFASTSGPYGYTPTQIRHAYGFDQISGNGSGQTIGIVVAYGSPTIQSDLNTFSAQFGISTTTLSIAYPQGKPSTTDGGWALETSLDVEWAHAIAPGARILLVVAPSASFNALLTAVDYATSSGAKQVSMSWGGSEFNGETYYDSHFNHSGVSYFAASGDNGTGVQWPAVSRYVSGVGGTTLHLDSYGNRTSAETAWSGSGGGVSSYVSEPSFQTPWQSSGRRTVPDVSYNADPNSGVPVYDSTPESGQTGWFMVGGTSAGTPQWAALFALVNSARTSTIAASNNAIYACGTPSQYTSYFTDITSGCDGTASVTTCAKTGLDDVTGIGAPKSAQLVPYLRSH